MLIKSFFQKFFEDENHESYQEQARKEDVEEPYGPVDDRCYCSLEHSYNLVSLYEKIKNLSEMRGFLE